jgi:hypothetical protein
MLARSSPGATSAKAIHLPSGDQLIRVKLYQLNQLKLVVGIRVGRNFLSGPPSAGTT